MRRKAEREMGGRWIWMEDADDSIERSSSQGFSGIDELGNPRSDDRCSTRRIVKSQCKTEEIEPGKFVRKCERSDQLLRECIGRPVEIVESNTESTEEDVTNEIRSGSLPFEHSTGFEPFNFPGLRNDIDALERSMFGGLGRLMEAAEDIKNDFFQAFGSPYDRDSSFPRWKPAERIIENETPTENNGTAAYKDFAGHLRDV